MHFGQGSEQCHDTSKIFIVPSKIKVKPPDKVCVSCCIPILSFVIGDPSSFEFACRGIHHGFPALGD